MTDNQDRLEVIKQGLPEQVRHDDWGGHFLTAEGEFGWPGAHVDWLIAEVERLREELNVIKSSRPDEVSHDRG